MTNSFTHLLLATDNEQKPLLYLLSCKPRNGREKIVDIFLSTEHINNWIVKNQLFANSDEECDMYRNLFVYNEFTFASGETIRVYPYQLNTYEAED